LHGSLHTRYFLIFPFFRPGAKNDCPDGYFVIETEKIAALGFPPELR
jgi:hypothetical protein